MMISEFIERTGWEPTPTEWKDIESEYMATDIDKDKFCKEWKRNGGIQRLSRIRARKIEELECKLATNEKSADIKILNLQMELNQTKERLRMMEECNVRLSEILTLARDLVESAVKA